MAGGMISGGAAGPASPAMRSRIGCGVPAGATKLYQGRCRGSGSPPPAIVGTSGKAGDRRGAAMASGRILPSRARAITPTGWQR